MPHIKFPCQIFTVLCILLFEEVKYKIKIKIKLKRRKKGLLLENMLSLFASSDNSLTQKEIDCSMQKDRKYLDPIPAILCEECYWMNDWINHCYVLCRTLYSQKYTK